MNLIDTFIRDVTKVGGIPKSEVRARLRQILESVVPEEAEYIRNNLLPAKGFNACLQETLSNITKLLQ